MYLPLLVANHFVTISIQKQVNLDLLQLIKLTYISHGWYLSFNNKPLLTQNPEAWRYGPVVSDVYYNFKDYKKQRIIQTKDIIHPSTSGIELQDKDKQFLNQVFDVYSPLSGLQLSTLTHKEGTPWYTTWYERGGSDKQNVQIDDQLIKEFYDKKNGIEDGQSGC